MTSPGLSGRGSRVASRGPVWTALVLAGLCTAASATPRTYRYFRFTQTELRVPATALIQVSEFRFFNGATPIPMTGVTVTNPGGNNPANEIPARLTDGLTNTKWLDLNKQPVIFDFGAPVTVDRYDYSTANDASERDPVSWTMEGSDDNATWTLIDEVKGAVIPTTRQAAAAQYEPRTSVFTLNETAIPYFNANKTVILNGDGNELNGKVSMATSASIDQGVGPVDPDIDFFQPLDAGTIPEDADTVYTLSGTSVDGTHSESITVRSVEGGPSTFRYVRFTPVKLRRGNLANSVQLSEFRMLDGATLLTPVAFTSPGSNFPANESPDKLYDGSLDSKWLDFNRAPVIFDYGIPVTFDGYYFSTANDAPDRDPVQWRIEGSDDLATWTIVENMTAFDFPVPPVRKASIQDVPLPGASIKPIASLAGDAPKLIAGEPLVLTWSTALATTVTIDNGVGPVDPSGTLVVNPAADVTYTLTATTASGVTSTSTFAVDVVSPAVTTIAYDDFDDAGEELTLINDATVLNDFATIPAPADAKRLRLTGDVGSRSGTAWFRKRQDLSEGFSTEFDVQLVTLGTTAGADGMAFIIQNAPQGNAAVPSGAAEDGLAANALNLKIDSHDNGDADPSAAFLQLRAGGQVLQTADLLGFPSLMPLPGTDATDLTMNSGSTAPYRLRVDYVPGDLDVYFNEVLVIDSAVVDLEALGAVDANGTAYVGFAARTGGAFEAHDVTSWTLTEGPPPPPPVTELVLTSHVFDLTAGTLQLTWQSSSAATYRVTSSTDLADWSNVVVSAIAGAPGSTSTTVNLVPGTRVFYRVEQE